MLIGGGTVLYSLTVLAQAVIQSEMFEAFGIQRKTKEMEKLENHYIVCGGGRVGRRIVRALQKEKIPFVMMERDEKKIAQLEDECTHILIADARRKSHSRRRGTRQRFSHLFGG